MPQKISRLMGFFGLVAAALVLAGCSLVPAPQTPSDPSQSTVFQTKPSAGSIWKSEDGGRTFEPRSTVDDKTKISTADVLAVSFLDRGPENTPLSTVASQVYVGTVETGIFRTETGGDRWEHIVFPPQKIYSFIVDRSDPTRMFATGVISDRGKLFRTTDRGETWQEMYTEPGQNTVVLSLAQHPHDTGVIFSGTSTGTVIKSTDKGDTWKNVGQKIDGPVTGITFDASQPRTVYSLAFRKKVWYSATGGEEWIDWEEVKRKEQEECRKRERGRTQPAGTVDPCARINDPKRSMPQNIVSMVADPVKSGRLLAGTEKGLFVSDDFGKYWDEINIIESARKFPIRAIAVNPKNSDEIVFVAGRAFYKSVNGGETWAVVQLNVDRDISVIQYDPFDPAVLYLGLRKF